MKLGADAKNQYQYLLPLLTQSSLHVLACGKCQSLLQLLAARFIVPSSTICILHDFYLNLVPHERRFLVERDTLPLTTHFIYKLVYQTVM